jgi:hypothetical protein
MYLAFGFESLGFEFVSLSSHVVLVGLELKFVCPGLVAGCHGGSDSPRDPFDSLLSVKKISNA